MAMPLTLVLWCALQMGAEAKALLDAPDAATQATVKKSIFTLFSTEVASAKTPEKKLALVRKWLSDAANTKDDPAARFVLRKEAALLAAGVGNAGVMAEALERIADEFRLNTADVLLKMFEANTVKSSTKEEARAFAALAYDWAERACALDDLASAQGLARRSAEFARRSTDALAIAAAEALLVRLTEMQAAREGYLAALKTLERKPDDATANLAAGRYYCLFLNQWSKGLPMLALGNDADLSAVARKELVADGKSTLELADAWMALASKQKGTLAVLYGNRAVKHYEKVAATLEGLARKRVEKQISEHFTAHPERFFLREKVAVEQIPNIWEVKGLNKVFTEKPWDGRVPYFQTHPVSPSEPAVLKRHVVLPLKPVCKLLLQVSSIAPDADWVVRVTANGTPVMPDKVIGGGRWQTVTADLAPFAGQAIVLEIHDANGGGTQWYGEQGLFQQIAILP